MDERTRAWVYRVGAVAILALIVADVVQGGGGGGAFDAETVGGAGGSGIVLVRYPTP